MAKPVQPPIEQYSVLESFSSNSFDNIKQLLLGAIGTPPVTGYQANIGDVYDMSHPLELHSCILENSFEITETDETTINVGTGSCIIGGVVINITGSKNLTVDDADSYFDDFDVITATGTLYVLIFYDYGLDVEEGTDVIAYIGLMKKTDYIALSDATKEKYCFLGALKIDSQIEIISPFYYEDPDDDTQTRPYPYSLGDGGWLDVPGEFIV